MTAYYNENDPFAAAWLRELIKENLIAQGDVDERSIKEVQPEDLRKYTQCHFFAGIGVWSYALRQAKWSDDTPVWTGSCPCQPFSAAGKKGGFDDTRHLWPDWFRLIRECRPDTVFGEQVASKDGLNWFDLVSTDLEGEGYAVGAADLCAAGFGAPHIRQRLYFVADSTYELNNRSGKTRASRRSASSDRRSTSGLGNSDLSGSQRRGIGRNGADKRFVGKNGVASELAKSERRGCQESNVSIRQSRQNKTAAIQRGTSYWSAVDWIPCADGKERPVEPGTFPLVTGATNRVGRLRGYGNALNAEVAKGFIEAYLEVEPR